MNHANTLSNRSPLAALRLLSASLLMAGLVACGGGEEHKYKNIRDKLAEQQAAKKLAQRGYVVVNGGGPGVMDAATRGAESVGGKTESVTFYPEHASGFEGRYLSNVTDKEIRTDNYIERMYRLMEESDIFLFFKGGTGTVSELGTAWVLAKLYYGHHKPFILFGDFWIGYAGKRFFTFGKIKI